MTGMHGKIRVLIVEDSHVQRRLLEAVISADPRLEVAASVASGEAALEALDKVRPDVITMDIRLPGIDGLETTKRIMKRRPTPIVVVAAAAAADQGKISINALRAGALSVVEKPRGFGNVRFGELSGRLCRQITLMNGVKLVRQRRPDAPAIKPRPPIPVRTDRSRVDALGIVASTGGPNAIMEILCSLGPDYPAPVFVVQHITASFVDSFVGWLNDASPLPVVLAGHGGEPQPGFVYVAPGDGHLEIANARLAITRRPPVSSQRPSGTVLFESMARTYGANCIGVLLTGMGDDGADGLRAIFDAGGRTIAEDETTAVVYGMPGAAIARGAVGDSLPLPLIAPRLRLLAAERAKAAS